MKRLDVLLLPVSTATAATTTVAMAARGDTSGAELEVNVVPGVWLCAALGLCQLTTLHPDSRRDAHAR